jgi:hypothetical protein
MQTEVTSPAGLPFELGGSRSFGGLTLVRLYPAAAPG